MLNSTYSKRFDESDEKKESPSSKALRVSIVRLSDRVASKMFREKDPVVLANLNGALTLASIAVTILGEDVQRANKLISKARQLASISEKEEV